ncbi:glutaredoxin domain-containing protein [Bacillus stercoris]|uniref:Glutaredoxin domain-containing protein n=1 Tax=Bacillus stercoris TaxID=2054641 RepID=A0ABU0V248_9BACI|nr:glutaredoxin domain-containing protein [Bacillus stercoris]MDQ1850985.1 glutaredoxin domain-containing protein [Bacillus stercoris]
MRLIKLEQPNCNPCKMVTNYLEQTDIQFETVDVTQEPEVALTILLNDQGEEVNRSIGFKPNELDELLKELR